MSRRQKREHKKREDVRRQRAYGRTSSHVKHGAAALASAAVIAAGTAAYASPVRFDNPAHGEAGHFHWAGPAGGPGNILDIVLPASDQPGSFYDLTTAEHRIDFTGTNSFFNSFSYYGYVGLGVQATGDYYGAFALGFNGGDLIPNPSGFYDPLGDPAFTSNAMLAYSGFSYLAEGIPQYLGMMIGGQFAQYYGTAQFGWIGGVLTGAEFEAFAWGYETDIMTPIPAGAPEPGSLALLAMGAGALLRRKRPA